jgi:NAD(P)H-dependent FMN reductase
MANRILVFYGSYRSDRMGIRLADFVVAGLRARGDDAVLIDARAVGLPMLDRMYKEYPKGEAPPALEQLAGQIRSADGFVFVTGEYNWGIQPGLKNLTDHFLEEWFWRPAAIASYSAGRLSGVRAATAWHGTLSEMGMVVISSTLSVGPIAQTLSAQAEPTGEAGKRWCVASRALPTTSAGGSRRRKRSGRRRRRRIERLRPVRARRPACRWRRATGSAARC